MTDEGKTTDRTGECDAGAGDAPGGARAGCERPGARGSDGGLARRAGRAGIGRRDWLRRSGGAVAGAGLGALLGPAGRGIAGAQGPPKRGGILRVATVDKPVNMDPGYAQLYSSLQVYQNVYSKLVYADESGQFGPGLARAWRQDNDKTWTFDLVDNAVFHNGEPFTARDVAFTFTRLLDPKNKLPMRVFFAPVEGVEAIGPAQVRFHLSRPYGPLLAVLSQATEIVNEKAIGAKDPKLFPVGPGRSASSEWVKDDHITLERWDRYFRPGKPSIDRIVFYAPADDTVRLTGLQTGRFNWIQTVPPQRVPELERARDIRSSPGRPYFPFFFMLNASKPPLSDKRLRQAIGWALDRDEIIKLVYFNTHVLTAEPTPEPSPWATGVNAQKGGPDLARARQLLADAGVSGGLTLTYLVKSQVPVLVKTGEILREQLKKVGDRARGAPPRIRPVLRGAGRQEVRRGRGMVERDGGPRHVLLPAPALFLGLELLRLQVGGGGPPARRLPLHGEPGRPQEDVSGAGPLVPGGRLAPRLQQRDPALLDEAERPRFGAAALARAALRGHLDLVTPPSALREWAGEGRRARTPGSRAGRRPAPWRQARSSVRSPGAYAARRLALAVPLLLGMSVLVFGLMRLVPGDPAVVVLGYKATPEGIRAFARSSTSTSPCPSSTCAGSAAPPGATSASTSARTSRSGG